MDFINFEVMDTDQQNEDSIFSDDENKDSGKVDNNIIDVSKQKEIELSFYWKFINQTKDPRVAIYEESDDETFVDTRDLQHELYAVENKGDVIFDEFTGYKKYVTISKKPLSSFEDSRTENSFFDGVIYGLYLNFQMEKSLTKDEVESVLGREFYNDFFNVKDKLKLNTSLYGFFDKCFIANELLAKKHFFF